MAWDTLIYGLLLFGCSIRVSMGASDEDPLEYMSKEEREKLKEEARDMFYHAYHAYMDNAYPADELMPLSCKGRYRGSEPNRGDIDSTLGNFSLTLVDTLDTLVVLGDLEEFENAVRLVVRDVKFDTDVVVSLFETNIRMLGGLLSGHILAEYLQQRADIMPWYKSELLDLAKDLGYRFLPAFNTTTGIPYGRINLKYGMKGIPVEVSKETCTACAGSMILEMATLSRLTGEPIFEEKAQKAMDVLWRMRHRGTDLMGSVLNVHSGDWVRRDSGVGAGIDSYYEYCLKAYILLGDEKYLGRFNKHYQAIMKYVSQGPMLLDVHMHRPNTNSKNFMDALLAFWPGLQVLKGDIKPAVETHEMLYQVMQRHNFIPEAFTTDFQVHWGHHPLRPEFLESTYFLYRATGDHYYLGVGRKVLRSLQTYARVPCGYAAVSDVRTNKHDDTMDSFVLSETLKYLFLLFAEPIELVLNLDEFIFTTEGHLLPLTLAAMRTNVTSDLEKDVVLVDEFDRACPNSLHLFPASVRQPLRNMVEDVCPRRTLRRRLSAAQFQAGSLDHLTMLSDMGITILTLADGRVQLLHTFGNAKTPQDAEEGLLFMQEMVELSKMQTQQMETSPRVVTFTKPDTQPPQEIALLAGPAHFGPELKSPNKISGNIAIATPIAACTDLTNADALSGKVALIGRGDCMFIEKARRIQQAGAIAGIVFDDVVGSSAATSPLFAMSGDGKESDDVKIPVVFLFSVEGSELMRALLASHGDLTVTIGDFFTKDEAQLKAPTDLSMFERLKGSLQEFLSRQMTPQNSASTGTTADTGTAKIDQVPDKKRGEIVRYEFAHFRAVVTEGPFEEDTDVKISANLYIPVKVPQVAEGDQSKFEKKWRNVKQAYVNEIFANSKKHSSYTIKSSVIKYHYKLVQLKRGLRHDAIVHSNGSLSRLLFWFMRELSQVAPDFAAVSLEELIDSRQMEALKQHFQSKTDDMLLLRSVAAKFKTLKSMNPEVEQLSELLESGKMQLLDNYALLKDSFRELFDGQNESAEHFAELSEHIQSVVQYTNQLRKELESPTEITRQPIDGEPANAELADDESKGHEGFAHPEMEESEKTREAEERIVDEESTRKEVRENEESDRLSSRTDKIHDAEKSITDFTSSNKTNDADERGESESSEDHSDFLIAGLEDSEFGETTKIPEQSSEKTIPKDVAAGEDANVKFLAGDADESRSANAEVVSKDEKRKLLREIQQEISDSRSVATKESKETKPDTKEGIGEGEALKTEEPLEEFRKPAWSTDDEGKATESFSEFQRKSDVSRARYGSAEVRDFDYQSGEEYSVKREGANARDKHSKGRHIDDEL